MAKTARKRKHTTRRKSDEQRAAVWVLYGEGYSVREIAQRTDMDFSTAAFSAFR